jgi:selenocysteine-specific translation elongation factor
VGTGVLGMIKQGKVKVHDQLKIMPIEKDIQIKSKQMHDDTAIESQSSARVGLAVKGMQESNINRGDLICHPNTIEISPEKLHTNFTESLF